MYAAIDVGGTKIAAGLVDAAGQLLARFERPTPTVEPMAAVEALLDLLAADARWPSVEGVGIGSAGPIDAGKGTVSPVNIPAWRGFPLVRHVADRTGLPVTLAGDAVAMAAGEHWRGAARGRENVVCMVVSTGVGGGLILGGRLWPGPSGNAGHIGHVCVELDGDPCPCGARGCLEIVASGTAIAAWAVRQGWRPSGGHPDSTGASASSSGTSTSTSTASSSTASESISISTSTANPSTASESASEVTAADVAEAARAGDPIALASFDRAAKALAAGIAGTAALVDLEAAVIGGGVAKAGDLLFEPLRRHLREYATLSFTRDITVEPAALGGDAGLIGAAALVAHAQA